ncbi:unnamed protein product [Protopolystoma xenopodis]|uniref:Homeobox domain-containing protein n=1 Tax=Protopolystoma xenopodis TaxID=117903 RepID=A0A448WMZ0_9PLAT|nr:unnamed protein product [Protopolystoma xenopodis]
MALEVSTVANFFMNARRRSLDKWQEEDSKTSSLADSNSSRSTPTHVGQLLTESGGRPSGLGDDCSAGASGKGSGCSETGQQMIMCRAGEGPLSSPQSDSEIRQLSVGRLAGIDDDNLSPSGGTHMNTHNSLSAGRNGQHSCPLPQYSHPQLPSLHHSNHPHHSHHQLHHHHHHHHNTLHPHLGHIPHSGTNMHNRSHQLPHLIYVNNNPSVVGRSCDTDGSNVPLLGQTSDEVGSFSANFIPDQQHHHHHHHQQPVISSQHIYLQGNAHGMAQMPQHYNGPPAAVAPASFDSNRHTQAVYASTLKGPLLEVAFGQDNSSGANNCSLLHSSQHTSSQLRALMTPTQQFFPASLDQGHRALTEQETLII